MQFESRKDHRRNENLEALLKEVNDFPGPVDSQVSAGYEWNKYPFVLVMGNPRSGTTLFMQWLASLGCSAYPTNLLSRFYGAPYIGAKIQFIMTKHDFTNELFDFNPAIPFVSRLGKTKGVVAPNKFWYFWRRFFPYGEIPYLDEEGLGGVDDTGFLREVAAMEAIFDTPFAGRVFSQITDRFQEQGHPADWSYAGVVSFEPTHRVSIAENEVEQVVAAYQEFSGETLTP